MGKSRVDGNARSSCAFATGRLHFLVHGRRHHRICLRSPSKRVLLHPIPPSLIHRNQSAPPSARPDTSSLACPPPLHTATPRSVAQPLQVSLSDPDRVQHRRCAQGSLWPYHDAGTARARPHYRQACPYTRARPQAALGSGPTCRLWTRPP